MARDFYDELAPFYHLIFDDWNASIDRQAAVLDRVIRQEWGDSPTAVLDASCGIGTQALGLAQRGYDVTASDLSPEAIARAREEAAARGLDIDFSVADMRQLRAHHQRTFDVVVSGDNSVPHLLTDADIQTAFEQFYRCTAPGGGCLITVRDYAQEDRSRTQVKPISFREAEDATVLVVQVWEWDGAHYDLSMYVVRDDGTTEEGTTRIFRSRYYAVELSRLKELMREVGFRCVRRVECDYYQPVLVGSRGAVVPRGTMPPAKRFSELDERALGKTSCIGPNPETLCLIP